MLLPWHTFWGALSPCTVQSHLITTELLAYYPVEPHESRDGHNTQNIESILYTILKSFLHGFKFIYLQTTQGGSLMKSVHQSLSNKVTVYLQCAQKSQG